MRRRRHIFFQKPLRLNASLIGFSLMCRHEMFEIMNRTAPWRTVMIEGASGRDYFTAAMWRNRESLRGDPTAFAKVLSDREQEVLCYVASGWTSRSIAGQLTLSPRSVETYRYRIMRKLEIKNLAGL